MGSNFLNMPANCGSKYCTRPGLSFIFTLLRSLRKIIANFKTFMLEHVMRVRFLRRLGQEQLRLINIRIALVPACLTGFKSSNNMYQSSLTIVPIGNNKLLSNYLVNYFFFTLLHETCIVSKESHTPKLNK